MFGGFGLMRYYFWPGIAVVYVWFAVLIWEICFEPELIKRPVWIQVVGIGIVGVLFDIFTIGVVAARAPIDIYSYAMRSGNYSDGTDIGGITWNSHFTALTVAITNSTADDYTDLDLTVRPDKLTYKAVIFGDSAGCNLSSIGGNTIFTSITKGGATKVTMQHLGESFEAQDNVGDVFTPLATESGYRLRCGKFPGRFTIRIVFGLVAIHPDLIPKQLPAPGKVGMSYVEIAGPKSGLDILDSRPSPSTVIVTGNYARKLKPYSIGCTIPVKDGN